MSKNVLTVTAEASESTVSYSGTTEDEVLAVACSLLNADGEEVEFNSVAVENNAFSGAFSAAANTTYTVACANYDGGAIVSSVESEPVETPDSPNTGYLTTEATPASATTAASSVVLPVLGVAMLLAALFTIVFAKKRQA